MLGSGGGGGRRRELSLGSGVRGGCAGERLCGSCGLCCVFSLSVSLLFLFPLFAVLLNCPYPDPPVSACFFSILFRTPAGGGAAAWRFCCLPQLNCNTLTSQKLILLLHSPWHMVCKSSGSTVLSILLCECMKRSL